ncbi:MAG: serine acetyltransferase [Muribaculaceae bacterium]|nr:serine acetyltransferase [Muribaculaceae bacterium]
MKKYRDILRLIGAILCFWIYLPHILIFLLVRKSKRIYMESDLNILKTQLSINISTSLGLLLYFLHNNRYYRSVFYHRIGIIPSLLIGWLRPGDRYFSISKTTKIGYSFWFAHPYGTIINAESIGNNFKCIHLTTIGDNGGKRPIIGNNVNLGANVTIVGDVHIGDNVTIGAGSVVVNDIPSHSIAVGVPARVVKTISISDDESV